MPVEFLHGVEIVEDASGIRPLRAGGATVIGLLGTAESGPTEWTLVRTAADAAKWSGGTIPDALAAIQAQALAPVAVLPLNVQATIETAVADESVTLASGSATLAHKPVKAGSAAVKETVADEAVTLAGGRATLKRKPVDAAGVSVKNADASDAAVPSAKYDIDLAAGVITRDATVGSPLTATQRLKVSYTGAVDADRYTLNPQTGAIERVSGGTNPLGATAALKVGYVYLTTAPRNAAQTAAEAPRMAEAESVLGVRPTVLIAPGWTGGAAGAVRTAGVVTSAPAAAALVAAAGRMRAVAVLDGPDTSDADAIAYAGLFSDRRAYVVDPGVRVLEADGGYASRPASGYVAGVIARSDAERGFWWSPSNRPIAGIAGTTRPIAFTLGGADAAANTLNAANVAAVVHLDGYRLWGNRTASSDAKWAFLPVVRIADAIDEALLRSHLWAVDRNIAKTYLDDVAEGVRAYLRGLVGAGAILGGDCEPDADRNTPQTVQAGRVYFRVEFTPAYPAERLTFTSALTDKYVAEALGF